MRIMVIIIVILRLGLVSAAQPGAPSMMSNSQVSFSGGHEQLTRVIFKYLSAHNGLYDLPLKADSMRKTNKYYTALFAVNSDGKIASEIFVNGYNDSSNVSVVADAVRMTDGQWRNPLKKTQWISLPIYFVAINDEGRFQATPPPLVAGVFRKGKAAPLTVIDKIVIQLLPSMRKQN